MGFWNITYLRYLLPSYSPIIWLPYPWLIFSRYHHHILLCRYLLLYVQEIPSNPCTLPSLLCFPLIKSYCQVDISFSLIDLDTYSSIISCVFLVVIVHMMLIPILHIFPRSSSYFSLSRKQQPALQPTFYTDLLTYPLPIFWSTSLPFQNPTGLIFLYFPGNTWPGVYRHPLWSVSLRPITESFHPPIKPIHLLLYIVNTPLLTHVTISEILEKYFLPFVSTYGPF